MSSRRRLDISSLLCDDDESSASRPLPDTQLSRSPVHLQLQHHQPSVAVSPYPPNERNILANASRLHGSLHYEQDQEHHRQRREHENPRGLPSATILTRLTLQPSPLYSLPSASPVDRVVPVRRGRHSDGLREPGFPRPGSSTTQTQAHPHPYSQVPQPPFSSSPVDIHGTARRRRASTQLSPNQYSSTAFLQLSPSPSPSCLPNAFPSSARRLSVSPTDLSRSARPSSSGLREIHLQRSPVLPRPSEAKMYPSQRVSASLSPVVPTSGLSGLDVLVQAATEERERIDVHRRESGGEELQPLLDYTASARPVSHSSVERRSMEMLHAPPPTPPYTASSQIISHLHADSTDVYCKEQGLGGNRMVAKGRQSSPEAARARQDNISLVPQYSPRTTQLLSHRALRCHSHSPEVAHGGYEHEPHRLEGPSRMSSGTSRNIFALETGMPYATSSSARTTLQRASVDFNNDQPISSRFPHPISPVETTAVPYTRRSPPRSRPKPKRPGSVALAIMEKEVALTDRKQREPAAYLGESSSSTHRAGMSPPLAQVERKSPESISRSRQSNERGAADDEDVDDFFLSAFDSPRNTGRQIPPKKTSPIVIPSARAREAGCPAERWSYSSSRHYNAAQSTRSPTKSSSSPDRMNEMSDSYSPVRGALARNDEMMSDVGAETLDELVDAAGAATSEEERTEFDDQETENMEVDVENELLSLIDEPSEPTLKHLHHSKPPSSYVQRAVSAADRDVDFDRLSMPPPDALRMTSVQTKDPKKGSIKPKLKTKAGDAPRSGKEPQSHVEDSTSKSSKYKASSQPRPTKGLPTDKVKAAKMSKEPSTHTSASLPAQSMPITNPSTPTDEAFPMVTSSGRMITKSKKSAAAAPPGQLSTTVGRKKPAASGERNRNGSRSRSRSVMPREFVDPEGRREKGSKEDEEKAKDKNTAVEEPDEGDEDKLYCICRTQYDEDRVMIACDRCDEWYHTQCVDMPDLLVDLVDQFICPNCVAQNPSLNLQTTYKQRCFAGLKHLDPDSPDACHKPSRGAYSKYCSDECGVKYMHRKIQAWAGNGGDMQGLWESVKDAKRREGFVTREPGRTLPKAVFAEIQNNAVPKPAGSISEVNQIVADEEGRHSIVLRLRAQLQTLVREREEIKKELEVLSWRERLLQLASDRAESVGDCGWDQRLVYGDEEWLEFGAGVLESYEEAAPNGHSEDNQDMDVDNQAVVGEWWCRGKKKCERHMGWQKIRAADLERERSMKEGALADLTTREREIRNRIEDILHPQSRPTGSFPEATFKFEFSNANLESTTKKSKKKSAVSPT